MPIMEVGCCKKYVCGLLKLATYGGKEECFELMPQTPRRIYRSNRVWVHEYVQGWMGLLATLQTECA